jgi:hypothetical protein
LFASAIASRARSAIVSVSHSNRDRIVVNALERNESAARDE